MRFRRFLGVATAMTIFIGVPAAPALAAPPANDQRGDSILVTLGFSETIDTTEATTGAADAALNESCGAPATDASVWYRYRAAVAGNVVVDVSQSDYSAGVTVGARFGSTLETVACGPGTILFQAEANRTYYITAFDDQDDGGGNGGQLTFSLLEAPPSPTVTLTVDDVGRLDRRGNAIINGTYRCENGDFLEFFADLLQIQRRPVRGFFSFFEEDVCDGVRRQWEGVVEPDQGRFVADRALVVSFAFACGEFECADDFDEEVIRLRPPKE